MCLDVTCKFIDNTVWPNTSLDCDFVCEDYSGFLFNWVIHFSGLAIPVSWCGVVILSHTKYNVILY